MIIDFAIVLSFFSMGIFFVNAANMATVLNGSITTTMELIAKTKNVMSIKPIAKKNCGRQLYQRFFSNRLYIINVRNLFEFSD